MLISDIARQYKNTTASAESMSGTRGVEKLVSSVRDLTAGNVFEGTVNSIQNGKIMLGLSNGTQLAARLETNMQLVEGQSMFFQVKSNDGTTIAIRPYTVDGTGANLTLLNALKTAGLPVTDKYLNMANAMMQEQMPIDKNSMMQMARLLMANPDMSVNTIVQMKKLDIPITKEMAAWFENYADDTNAIHKELQQFVLELPEALSNKEMSLEQLKQFDSQLLTLLADGMEEVEAQKSMSSDFDALSSDEMKSEQNTVSAKYSDTEMEPLSNGKVQTGESEKTTSFYPNKEESNLAHLTETAKQSIEKQIEPSSVEKTVEYPSMEKVVKFLNHLFGEDKVFTQDSPSQVLRQLSDFLLQDETMSKETLGRLFSSKSMTVFLKDVLEEQMYLLPKDVADGEKIKKLYSRLEEKSQELEILLVKSGMKDTPLAQTISQVRGNIEFMNQLNHVYTYVQIPLKMAGQNATGELYVYTNKRNLGDSERELTAFLHLDMDHLGSTDVSVRLHRKNVDTKFYMDNDASYTLIKAHMKELEERLNQKGFYANIHVENEGKSVDFVKDFLKKDIPSTGQLHRYSFDVRA